MPGYDPGRDQIHGCRGLFQNLIDVLKFCPVRVRTITATASQAGTSTAIYIYVLCSLFVIYCKDLIYKIIFCRFDRLIYQGRRKNDLQVSRLAVAHREGTCYNMRVFCPQGAKRIRVFTCNVIIVDQLCNIIKIGVSLKTKVTRRDNRKNRPRKDRAGKNRHIFLKAAIQIFVAVHHCSREALATNRVIILHTLNTKGIQYYRG